MKLLTPGQIIVDNEKKKELNYSIQRVIHGLDKLFFIRPSI